MTDLRQAAEAALNALSCLEYGFCGITEGPSEDTTEAVITTLRAALAEPVQEHNFCPRCGKRAYDIHTCTPPVADGDNLSPTEPVAWYHVPHPGNGISPVVSMSQQHEPSLYAVAVPLFIREQL